jgi:hypothetical protein
MLGAGPNRLKLTELAAHAARVRATRDAAPAAARADGAPATAAATAATHPRSAASSARRGARACARDAFVPLTSREAVRLFRWNAVLAVLHGAFVGVTLGLGNLQLAGPIYRTEVTFEDMTNSTARAADPSLPRYMLRPHYVELATALPLTWLTAAFFLITCVAHAGNAWLWRDAYEYALSRAKCPFRWVEYSLSAPVMLLLVAYGMGVRDYLLLCAIVVLTATTMPFGFLTEREARPASASEWATPLRYRLVPHLLGYVPQAGAWVVVLLSLYDEENGLLGTANATALAASNGTDPLADLRDRAPPAFVYAILWSQLLFFFSFGFVQLAQQMAPPSRYLAGEVAYQVLSLVCKSVLGGLVLANVLMLGDVSEAFA